jgi:O-antigen ligase
MLLNSHNGWFDTALAIGIIGAILYLIVYLIFLKFGLQTSFGPNKELVPYGVALFSLGFMWMVRSVFDSAQRDQMLEMQIFTLCLLSSYILFSKKTATTN